MKVAVFCTGGAHLGYGHFFRSKTFVKAAPADVEAVLVPIAGAEDRHIFKGLGDKACPCATEDEAIQVIKQLKPDILVFDTVSCTDDFFSGVQVHVKYTASISPVFNQMGKIDMLFTRNVETPEIENVTIYKGFEYVIFNEMCSFISDEIYYHNLSKEYLTIGISMGGGDAPNKTLEILKSVARLDTPLTIWVLLGEGYSHSYQDLVNSISKDSNHEIILAKTNRSMWNILSNCSLAILAGGLTTLEAVYAGLPSLNIFEKEEHVGAAGNFIFSEGMAANLGMFNAASLALLKEKLAYLSENKSALLQMREKSKGKIDKFGSFRIYEMLKKLKVHSVGIRSFDRIESNVV